MPCRAPLVIDTNIALDLFVFHDPSTEALRAAIDGASHGWLATDAMREELARVLVYPQIARRLELQTVAAEQVLDSFDQRVCILPPAPRATCICKDPDDQKFIDLAVAHRAGLLSKDAAVLCMARRLARLGVDVRRHWNAPEAAAPDTPTPRHAQAPAHP
ncbi:MAG: putative toxin-antitoxin system toxin component, PIN family [Hydrogenophaga sp.]|nr:putative toxin-antitoxin system toxin component, PIN family [Hydrogenophaga sp.]